jgi:hypothetical protein
LRFKITNRLKNVDYEKLAEFTKNHAGFSIELLPEMGFEHVSVSPITVAVEGFGFRIDAETSFTEPVGFELGDNLGLKSETCAHVTINRRSFRLSKIVTDQTDLEGDLNVILKAIERIVNGVCAMFDTQVERVVTLDSESLDAQLEVTRKRDELEKRGETPRPFGTIHADGSRDAKERAGGLIPLYKERDKAYLYDAKQVYYLLPHDFAVCLLRCDVTTLVRQEEFDSRGKDVLRDLVYRKYLKKRELFDGTVCYYGLDEKTRRYLKGHLEHKTPRR